MKEVIQKKAHFIGPFLFLLVLFLPLDLEKDQHNFLAIFLFVVANWLFSQIPLYITGFLGVALSSLMGVASAKESLQHFANPIIFLFLGGFLFAKAMNQAELDKRISLFLLSRSFIKGSFRRMLFILYALTAFFSMWVSNTATTAMMLPIILGTLTNLKIEDRALTSTLLLGLAYSASIGGLGTPIGSPPNIIAIGMLKDLAGINITFLHWTLMGVPFVIVFLLIMFKYITYFLPEDLKYFDNTFIKDEFKQMHAITNHEKTIALLFICLVFFWFAPSLIASLLPQYWEVTTFIKTRFNSGIVAMFFSSLLFVFPLKSKDKILTSHAIKNIDWPSLLLFGAGLSLGKILFATGLAKIAGDFIIANLVGGSFFLLIVILVYVTVFATELASNTASANILLPIVIAIAIQMNIPAIIPATAVAFACSLAFMLPVATPPNAIVYGTDLIEMKTMLKVGFLLNIVFGGIMALSFYLISYLI